MADSLSEMPLPEELSGQWDPEPRERRYYRHARTGERAYLVEREGSTLVKLDRPNQDITKPYNPGEWIEEAEDFPMTRMQLARVAYEADQALCFALGERRGPDWMSMHPEQRIHWLRSGPERGERRGLFVAILKALSHLVQS